MGSYVNVLFDEELLEEVDEYTRANRYPSRTEAIRRLVQAQLKLERKPPVSAAPANGRKRKSGD